MALNRSRVSWELKEIQNHPHTNCIRAGHVGESFYDSKAAINGPSNNPYVEGVFLLTIHFPLDYPLKPPKVTFKKNIYHPNIGKSGSIGYIILREKWSPGFTMSKVLMSIFSLMTDPILHDPLVPDIAHIYKTDKPMFESTARSWTQQYAM